jgi:hypothetical protein
VEKRTDVDYKYKLTSKPDSEMTDNEHAAVTAALFFMGEIQIEDGKLVCAASDKEEVDPDDYLAEIICGMLNDKDKEHVGDKKDTGQTKE